MSPTSIKLTILLAPLHSCSPLQTSLALPTLILQSRTSIMIQNAADSCLLSAMELACAHTVLLSAVLTQVRSKPGLTWATNRPALHALPMDNSSTSPLMRMGCCGGCSCRG